MADVDAGDQAQHVQFESLVGGSDDAQDSPQRYLNSRAAGRRAHDPVDRQKILADRRRWKRHAQLGNFPTQMGDKGVAVGARPDAVAMAIRVGIDGLWKLL